MAENQRKVNLIEIIEQLKIDLNAARLPANSRRRSQDEKAAGKRVHASLYSDGRATDNTRKTGKVSLTTYNRYLSDIRKALMETGEKSHTWERQIKAAIKTHANHKARFESLLSLPLSDVVQALAAWRKELSGDRDSVQLRELLKRGLRPFPVVFETLAMPAGFAEDFQSHQKNKIKEKQSSLINIDFSTLLELITNLLSTPKSDPYFAEKLALGISLASGRRQIEVCVIGTFLTEKSNYDLNFDGQAKTKGAKSAFTIPTLAPASIIIDAVKDLRETTSIANIMKHVNDAEEIKKNRVFNNKSRQYNFIANKVLNRAFKSKENGESWVFKDSRALYAKAAYLLYVKEQESKKKSICTEDIFYSEFLGHTDEQAKEAYKAFNVISKEQISRVTENMIAEVAETKSPVTRIEGLKKLALGKVITSNTTYKKVMQKIIELIEEDPARAITKVWLRKDVKGGKTVTLNALFEIIEKEKLTI